MQGSIQVNNKFKVDTTPLSADCSACAGAQGSGLQEAGQSIGLSYIA